MAIILFFLVALPICLLFLYPKHRNKGRAPPPPGPPGLPIIGNLHQLNNSNLQHQLWKLSQKYGPLMSLRLGFVPALVVSSAKMAKEVLKTHDLVFCSRPSLLGQRTISYNGLDVALSPYNEYWREMKKITTLQLFSLKRVRSFRPIREDEVYRMISEISELANSSKLANLSDIIVTLTSTIICRVAFGKRFSEQGADRSLFNALLEECQVVLTNFYVSDHFPCMGWVDSLSGSRARLNKNFKEMDSFYQDLINEHLDPKRINSMQEDIIDILLRLIEGQTQSSSIELTFDHIKGVLVDILLGGTDTSASTVIWAMTELMRNPKAMIKSQEEVRKLIGKKGRVYEDDTQNFPYLKAVVKEALRLHPPVPLLVPRETLERCVVNGYEVKEKTIVYVNAYAIGRDPECWESPNEFLPERFLGSTVDYKGQDYELIPFGAGRRGCPGISMGTTTVELVLSNLLYSFDWELPAGMKKDDVDTDSVPGITVQKKNALCLLPKNYYVQ